jgi:hypothetical protein
VLEIHEDALDSSHRIRLTFHINRVRPEIDTHMERIFHEPEVFVAGPEQGLKMGRDVERFSHQAGN